jgi:hypothetical protein
VSVRVWGLAALVRASIIRGSGAELDLLAGPALFFLDSRRVRLPTDDTRTNLDPGAHGLVRGKLRIGKTMWATAALEASVHRIEVFSIGSKENRVLTLAPVRLAMIAGLSWNIE